MNCSIFFAKYRRWILYLYSFLSISFVAGLVYGWPALRQQLLKDGSELNEKTLGAVFTVGAWSTQGGRFFTGLARDRFGTNRTVGICFVFVISGVIGIALSDPSNAISLGISLFAIGMGSGVQLCIQPVAGLFPSRSGTVLSSLSGAFQISGLVFLALTSGTVSRRAAFLGFAVFLLITGVIAVCLFPRGGSFVLVEDSESSNSKKPEYSTHHLSIQSSSNSILENPIKERIEDDTSISGQPTVKDNGLKSFSKLSDGDINETCHNGCEIKRVLEEECVSKTPIKSASVQGYGDIIDEESAEVVSNKTPEPKALEQIKHPEYILLCVWFSINLIPLQYYVGSIGFQLEQKGDDDGFYTDLFAIVYAAAALVGPMGGYLSDKAGLGVTQGVGSVLTAASLFILASDRISLPGQGVGLVLYGVGRMLVFGMFFTNAGKRFGYENFGTLAGLGLLISAVASLLQYPLIAAAADGNAFAVNTSSGIVLLCMIPYFFWLHGHEKDSINFLKK